MDILERQKAILLGFVTARAQRVERRDDPRLRSTAPARLVWRDGDEVREARARLIDISRGGVALRVTDGPPAEIVVQFRLEGDDAPSWIEAEVLDGDHGGDWGRARLKFRDPCPPAVLKAALRGVATPCPVERQESDAASSLR